MKAKPHRSKDSLAWYGSGFPLSHALCSVCGSEMNLDFNIHVQFSCVSGPYVHVRLFMTCTDEQCGYRETTKGESCEEETIFKLQDWALDFRGAEMHKKGKFRRGYVALKQARKTRYGFIQIPPPIEKETKGKRK